MDTIQSKLLHLFGKKANIGAAPIYCSFDVLCVYLNRTAATAQNALDALKSQGYLDSFEINVITGYITIRISELGRKTVVEYESM